VDELDAVNWCRLCNYAVMHFEGRLASGPEEICDLFAEYIQRLGAF
jgi:hypothetical protein